MMYELSPPWWRWHMNTRLHSNAYRAANGELLKLAYVLDGAPFVRAQQQQQRESATAAKTTAAAEKEAAKGRLKSAKVATAAAVKAAKETSVWGTATAAITAARLAHARAEQEAAQCAVNATIAQPAPDAASRGALSAAVSSTTPKWAILGCKMPASWTITLTAGCCRRDVLIILFANMHSSIIRLLRPRTPRLRQICRFPPPATCPHGCVCCWLWPFDADTWVGTLRDFTGVTFVVPLKQVAQLDCERKPALCARHISHAHSAHNAHTVAALANARCCAVPCSQPNEPFFKEAGKAHETLGKFLGQHGRLAGTRLPPSLFFRRVAGTRLPPSLFFRRDRVHGRIKIAACTCTLSPQMCMAASCNAHHLWKLTAGHPAGLSGSNSTSSNTTLIWV